MKLFYALLFVPLLAFGETVNVTLECNSNDCPICPECPVNTPVVYSANRHAIVHSTLAQQDGGESCRDCHRPGGTAITSGYVGLCSQYNFCTQRDEDKECQVGVALLDSYDNEMFDPVSGMKVVTGGKVAGYPANRLVLCSDCHYPHRSGAKVEDFMVHAGCLDCHKKAGSGDR